MFEHTVNVRTAFNTALVVSRPMRSSKPTVLVPSIDFVFETDPAGEVDM
jgi:hypothetical protein